MWKWVLIVAVFWLAACQAAAPTETPTETPDTSTRWLETEMNGVSLGIWTPNGWEADLSDSLVLAEHVVSTHGTMIGGMLINCFVPAMDEFQDIAADADNYAWSVLNQVVKMPIHTGHDVVMSDPAGFDWETFPAAYYLVSMGDGVRALVLALALPGEKKVVVCNVSVPASQAGRIRTSLPLLLDGLKVNGTTLHGSALAALPDPLPFPHYSLSATTVDNRMAANQPP
jgi:hypothetical protein